MTTTSDVPSYLVTWEVWDKEGKKLADGQCVCDGYISDSHSLRQIEEDVLAEARKRKVKGASQVVFLGFVELPDSRKQR